MDDRPIIQAQADQIFDFVLSLFERDVTSLLKVSVSANQFDTLVSFAYNVGSDIDQDNIPEGLGDSTLLRIINANPNSDRIPGEFAKWNKCKGRVEPGLTKRRAVEAHYYTTGILNF